MVCSHNESGGELARHMVLPSLIPFRFCVWTRVIVLARLYLTVSVFDYQAFHAKDSQTLVGILMWCLNGDNLKDTRPREY